MNKVLYNKKTCYIDKKITYYYKNEKEIKSGKIFVTKLVIITKLIKQIKII